jgi:hypothetical protein
LIDDVHAACPRGELAQGMNDKALSEERMRGIGDFDHFGIRVVEMGIKEWALWYYDYLQRQQPSSVGPALKPIRQLGIDELSLKKSTGSSSPC